MKTLIVLLVVMLVGTVTGRSVRTYRKVRAIRRVHRVRRCLSQARELHRLGLPRAASIFRWVAKRDSK